MNRADKIALGFAAVVGSTFLIAAGLVMDDQAKRILRQKKRIQLLEDTVNLMYRMNIKPDAKLKEDIIDHVVKHTPIPDDPGNL